MQGVVVVDAGNGKDGGLNSSARPPSRAALPPKLLLFAVLATGFLAVVVLLLSGGSSSPGLPASLDAALSAAAPASCARAEDGQLERWARRAPASAWHNMSDEELLWAASWQPGVRRYPYRRLPKVAFMFLTRGPLPLAPLWSLC